MNIRFAIFGAGRQGTASAYEMIVHGDASYLTLLDKDADIVDRSEASK